MHIACNMFCFIVQQNPITTAIKLTITESNLLHATKPGECSALRGLLQLITRQRSNETANLTIGMFNGL